MDPRSFVVMTWTVVSLIAAVAVLVGTENLTYGLAIGALDVLLTLGLFAIVGRLGIKPPTDEERANQSQYPEL
jgi:hypothetical protein